MNRHGAARPFKLAGPVGGMVVALGLAGATTILLLGSEFGLGASNDGVLYLSAARHLLEGSGLTDFRGAPLVIFPPLFSVLLSVVGLVGPSVETAARVLQALLYAGNFILAGILFARVLPNHVWLIVGVLLLLFSRTFLLYHSYVLSEPLFVLLTLGMTLLLCKWRDEGQYSLLVWAALLAGLSCLTRYPGVANTLAGSVVVLFSAESRKRRFVDASVFAAISLAPLMVWLARNALVAGSLTGDRLPSPYPFLLNLELVTDSIALWFVPDEVPQWTRLTLVAAGVAVIAVVLRKMGRTEPGRSSTSDRTVLATVAVSHVVVIVAATSLFASDFVSTRFVMPVYVPVIVLIVASFAWSSERFRRSRPFVAALVAGWMSVQAFTSVRLVSDRFENGAGGYATRAWRESDVMQFVRDNPDSLGTDAFSNATLGVYLHTGLVVDFLPDRLNPRWAAGYSVDALNDRPTIKDFRALVDQPERSVTLIWFRAEVRDPRYEAIYIFNQYSLDEIKDKFQLIPMYEAADGGVYRLYPR